MPVTLDVDPDGVATLLLDRPAKRNALDRAMLESLGAAVGRIASRADVRVVVVRGAGGSFCAGADIADWTGTPGPVAAELSRLGRDTFAALAALPVPSLAVIEGTAVGGGLELALACDIRVASTRAKLGLPEATLGLLPGFGGTQRLARLIGAGRALDLMLTARQIEAAEALGMGLVNYVADDALSKAREVAEATLKNAPIALSLIKEAVRRGLDTTLDAGLEVEADLFGLLCATKDFAEGVDAFLNKRKADFVGE